MASDHEYFYRPAPSAETGKPRKITGNGYTAYVVGSDWPDSGQIDPVHGGRPSDGLRAALFQRHGRIGTPPPNPVPEAETPMPGVSHLLEPAEYAGALLLNPAEQTNVLQSGEDTAATPGQTIPPIS